MALDRRRGEPLATRTLIADTLGTVSEGLIAAILATCPTVKEFEEAVAWASGESDVMGKMRRPLTGRAALIYDLLMREEDEWEEAAPTAFE